MASVLVIGYAPEAVDFTDPAIPSDMNAEKVASGIARDGELLRARGWDTDHLPIYADDKNRQRILDQLKEKTYDFVVIGAGVRLTTKHIPQFEIVIDAIREGAPKTPIAFNSNPDASSEAAARWIK